MYAVTFPNTPLFSEHFNPDLKIIELTGCPETGESMETQYSFGNYFHGMSKSDRQEILEAFDKDGYYDTFCDAQMGFEFPVYRYVVTLFPKSNNDSLHAYLADVAENFRNDAQNNR
tara:strand:- start:799 stop:1146 length:348 start_codon:yes stop_codon:yes gene_type:complete